MHRIFALAVLTLLLTNPALAQVDIGFGGVSYDESQPVEVTADGLTIDQATGEAVFNGNVIVVQGDLRMAAGAVRIVYSTDGAQEVSEVIATGGVLVTRGADAAEGGSARFDVSTALLTLSGNVLVTQGPTAIAGDSMVVDMRTGSGSVDGRVRTVLSGSE